MPINYKLYPPDWFEVIRPMILKREAYRCKFCGVLHKSQGYRDSKGVFHACDQFMLEWAKANNKKIIRIILTIMHLDHDITNNKPENLAAGCQQCHNRYDAKQRAFRRSVYYQQIQASKSKR